MAAADLNVELRELTGPQINKALRRQGRVPAIFYAHDEESRPLSLDARQTQRLVQSETNIINCIFPGGEIRQSIFRDVQKDPVSEDIVHVDIMGITLTEKVKLSIPIILKGSPLGVKEGGILEHLLREVEVEGLPLEIPEHLEVDVSELEIGDVLTLESIPADKFRFVADTHYAIANVVQPKVIIEETPEDLEEGEDVEGDEAEAEDEESQE